MWKNSSKRRHPLIRRQRTNNVGTDSMAGKNVKKEPEDLYGIA